MKAWKGPYGFHDHLAPSEALSIRQRGVRADADVVGLGKADGLVHDREVAVQFTK